jgi:hypothetical protein
VSNGLYAKGRQAFLEGSIAILTDDIRVILTDTADYTVNLSTHDFLDDVAAAGRVAVSPNISTGGRTSTDGVFNHGVVTFTAATGDPSEALIYYKHTGVEATSRLICYIDSVASGLPVIPNGGNITWTPDSGANKVFKL